MGFVLTKLEMISDTPRAKRHVIFVHGLRRLGHKVWLSSGPHAESWPLWLAEDIPELAVWTLEYDSAPTLWRGHSMARADRADNILAILLAEERLRCGDIAFVTHSFGGLVIANLLRKANERASSDPRVASFLERVSHIAFLGTPHLGADLATLGNVLRYFRLSNAAEGLRVNDPDLRDLSQFLRHYFAQGSIEVLSIIETKPTRWFGLVVKPNSADIGLPTAPVPVDEDHFSLTSPKSKGSEVYLLVRDHLRRYSKYSKVSAHNQSSLQEMIVKNAADQKAAFERIEQQLSKSTIPAAGHLSSQLVDEEVQKRLARLRHMRFFQGSTHIDEAFKLSQELIDGELALATSSIQSIALAWCARMLLTKPDRSDAIGVLANAKKAGLTEEVTIAEAFIDSYAGDLAKGLQTLARLDSDEARSASLIIFANMKGVPDALDWFGTAGLSVAKISSDGKFFLLKMYIETDHWAEAFATVETLTESDFHETPALIYMAASVRVMQVVPQELRQQLLRHLPFDGTLVPMADDEAAIAQRRTARQLYSRASSIAIALGCVDAGNEAADRALWLGLRDPQSKGEARIELERSMRDPSSSLRRLPLAIQFGLKLDLLAVEREIDRQDALTGGSSANSAIARLSIALTKNSPKAAAEYIEEHKERLLTHLHPSYLISIRVQMLVESGQVEQAEKLFNELPTDGEHKSTRDQLLRLIAEGKGANPVDTREEEFKRSNSLANLINLIERLEDLKDWSRLKEYGLELFNRTRDLNACRIYTEALYESGDFDLVLRFLDQHTDLVDQSLHLEAIKAWSYYQAGDVRACRDVLFRLRSKRDNSSDRSLLVNLTIATGDWSSLGAFVEQEWEKRGERTGGELLRAGQLAQQIGSQRVRDIVLEAVSKSENDPGVLLGAYSVAVSAGWEDAQTAVWLERAADLSGDDGPVKRVTLKEVLDHDPEWQDRARQTWEQFYSGGLPMFGASHVLNRSLLELFLIPALSNTEVTDIRRRSAVLSYSGARLFINGAARSAAIDPTALMTLGMTGDLEKTIASFEKIVIPHSTLAWLFEEKQRIQFHQPSRVEDSREIKRLIDLGLLKRLERSASVDAELVVEVGDDLAALVAEAETYVEGGGQRVVVRSAPVHRLGSLMEEEANLGVHSATFCDCMDVVDALVRQGQLTQTEEQDARAYLKLRERAWPHSTTIELGARLFLDELSVTYLQHLKLLGKLQSAGFEGIVPPAEISQGEDFARYEDVAKRATPVVEYIRRILAEGILSGKVLLAPAIKYEESNAKKLRNHPAIGIVAAAALTEVVIIDDRFFNQHGTITVGSDPRPVWTTLDALRFANTGEVVVQEFLTKIRKAGFVFVPLAFSELHTLLARTTVSDGKMLETAELRAIRENLLLTRFTNSLQLPKESVWLGNILLVLADGIKSQWIDGADYGLARARSNWLLEQFDTRFWAHRIEGNVSDAALMSSFCSQVLSLAKLDDNVSVQTRQMYWQWFEEMILSPLREEQRPQYAEIVQRARALILEVTKSAQVEVEDEP